jgi:hypothetical protein
VELIWKLITHYIRDFLPSSSSYIPPLPPRSSSTTLLLIPPFLLLHFPFFLLVPPPASQAAGSVETVEPSLIRLPLHTAHYAEKAA